MNLFLNPELSIFLILFKFILANDQTSGDRFINKGYGSSPNGNLVNFLTYKQKGMQLFYSHFSEKYTNWHPLTHGMKKKIVWTNLFSTLEGMNPTNLIFLSERLSSSIPEALQFLGSAISLVIRLGVIFSAPVTVPIILLPPVIISTVAVALFLPEFQTLGNMLNNPVNLSEL